MAYRVSNERSQGVHTTAIIDGEVRRVSIPGGTGHFVRVDGLTAHLQTLAAKQIVRITEEPVVVKPPVISSPEVMPAKLPTTTPAIPQNQQPVEVRKPRASTKASEQTE